MNIVVPHPDLESANIDIGMLAVRAGVEIENIMKDPGKSDPNLACTKALTDWLGRACKEMLKPGVPNLEEVALLAKAARAVLRREYGATVPDLVKELSLFYFLLRALVEDPSAFMKEEGAIRSAKSLVDFCLEVSRQYVPEEVEAFSSFPFRE